MSLLKNSSKYAQYKPHHYPWAYEAYETIQQMHWIAKEINISSDVVDYHKLPESERVFIRNILRLFTTNDVQALSGYTVLTRVFKPIEVQMMLFAEGNTEAIHIDAYSLLTDSLGFPDSFYQEYIDIPVQERKIDYLEKAKVRKLEEYIAMGITHSEADFKYRQDVARMLAIYAAGLEGIELMAQFALLLAYQSLGMFRGMSQINTYSVKDECMHCKNNSMLFLTYVKENPDIYTKELQQDIVEAIKQIVEQEAAYTDYLYNIGTHPTIPCEKCKAYTEFMADRALTLIGLPKIYDHTSNPIPEMDEILGSIEFSNFFEIESTAYAKNAIVGSWSDVADKPARFRKN